MANKVLRSFLVGLGFKIDDKEWRRFDLYWKTIANRFVSLGAQATAASLEIAAAVTSIADELNDLYYVSQRTGASVGGVQAFQFGAKQIGLTADQATQALEGLSDAMRNQPGLKGVLSGFGIDPEQKDHLQTLLKLVDVLRRMPYFQGVQYAKMFGIDDKTFLQLSTNFDKLQGLIKQRQHQNKTFGINPDELAKQSVQFHNDIVGIEEDFKVLGMVLARTFLPVLDGVLKGFDWILEKLGPLDAATNGWSTRLLAVAAAFLSVNRAMAIGRFALKSLLGGGARGAATAAVGEGEAVAATAAVGGGEAAAAGGAGVLGTLLSLPVIVAAVLGYIATSRSAAVAIQHMLGLPDKITADWLKQKGVKAKEWFQDQVYPASKVALGVAKDFGIKMAAGLVNMVEVTEGFRSKAYPDAGKFSIGFGHQIQPGEKFGELSRPQAEILLKQDLSKVDAGVHGLVKRMLNSNQFKALDDLAYNIGLKAFAGSSLLRKVNQGDMAGALQEFGKWNKTRTANGLLADRGLTARRAEEASLFKTPVGLNQETNIHVHGANDPAAVGREVSRQQQNVNNRIVRNLGGVIDTPGGLQ